MSAKLERNDGEFALPREVVCELFGIKPQTLHNWLKEAAPPPRHDDGTFPAKATGEWIRKKQTLKLSRGKPIYLPKEAALVDFGEQAGLPSAFPKVKTIDSERMRKESAQADKLEMENGITRGELILADEVLTAWASILTRVKTRMLRIPFTAAPVIVGDDNLISVQKKISEFIKDGLSELSADWRDSDQESD